MSARRTSTMNERRRVVVTGLGVLSALGMSPDELWASLIAGKSAMAPIQRFDTSQYRTRFAAEMTTFDPATVLDRKQARRMDRFTQFAVVAARQAVAQSGVDVCLNPERVGVVLGSALSGFETFETATETMLFKGPRRVSPFAVPMTIPNMAPGTVAIDLGARGPAFAHASAFASSAHSIGEAMRMIQDGRADVVLAGGSEACITPLALAGFDAMGSLSRHNDAPERAVRPFDRERDGCAMAEGAGILVLEALDHAHERGANSLAELAGYGATADAFHEVQIAPEGQGIARAMSLAMKEAEVDPSDIGYLNAHGTATVMNDAYETTAIKHAFGSAADSLAISSTKSMTGHLLGAAGGLEAAISIMAMTEGVLPPTINLTHPDPACDLDYIPGEARQLRIDTVMSNSMGFGGHNVSLVFRKV
ncbi:MAG: 3-oxoacyl-[acyl-carrier-protein] synthase, KASII [uncultured Thermomicrobiales bacterium]|uniref:3-oxoacyl-[acyl-carrier-protein] synthase 2 n=1 Tax=uncultured Thermomicrobiales bacterium TaxID=1645740 RepID=A0A6J4U6J7_9BACT|nr:MAG: 3-oxoacyl-[acyl-carrier-protein] synthase, KASII [uncultured Thermomicrobiales bacterium]